ncbi:YVTN repeat-like/Quino protein amine dehydrogenase [Stereum hirsutum FP-91666 SS1]|uniref:YVTN repeat-like/Quino protein amine dehydrogenase n=1 Tax=Stereum hirsutum (strain FP-91666) TaxID=721885 RepID=UPI000440C81E|nr:YVTN repeat-like/Quino protein amine dehydrogenase [Stereum hirsutum FP-91666 SS1]EIM92727.1 YVTN repeat-like/Quino protein amine dehydrogenase [Stereum hirsutum FP-91666 SS1]
MDFTEIFKQSSGLVSFSPGAHFLLTAATDRVIIRRADTFQISRSWAIDPAPSATASLPSSSGTFQTPTITHLAWSSDSEFVLAACAKAGVVHVFRMSDDRWYTKVEAGVEGLTRAEWAPDGRHIVCFSDWALRVTIWSLVSGVATYIQYPLHPDRGYTFRRDGRYFVLAERHKSKDTIGVYDAAEEYRLARHYPLPTSYMSSLSLSPTGNHLAIWEGPMEYKLYILSLAGDVLGTFTPDVDPGFGIRTVAWHPSGMFLAVGGWDDKIHILENLTWSRVATLELVSRIPAGTTVWREPTNWIEATEGRGFLSYERLRTPHALNVLKADISKANPKCGPVQLEFNHTGTALLVRFENVPHAIHLFSFPEPGEPFTPALRSVLLHSRPVQQARWNPQRRGSMAACCGGRAMYMWSDEWVGEDGVAEEMAECVGVPAKTFDARDLKWAPDGKGMILLDRDAFCCAFEVEDGLPEEGY